jgi:cytochrome c biogenesis protein CcdA
MMASVFGVASAPDRALGVGAIVGAVALGLRHGIDWDHLAAISDLAGTQRSSRRSMFVATCYAAGHAAVVILVGAVGIFFAARLPATVGEIMERVVGITLLALGVVIVVSLVRRDGTRAMPSRAMLVVALCRRMQRSLRARRAPPVEFVVVEHDHDHDHVHGDGGAHGHGHTHDLSSLAAAAHAHEHELHDPGHDHEPDAPDARAHRHGHRHRHVLPVPEDPFRAPGPAAAVGVGVLHGIGAETPTQVLVFAGAAGAARAGAGALLLVAFVTGLLVSNTLVALGATFGFGSAMRHPRLLTTVCVFAAACSVLTGALFVTGRAALLPTFA